MEKVISFRSEFDSKRYVFKKNDKIITVTNMSQHEIYLNGELNFWYCFNGQFPHWIMKVWKKIITQETFQVNIFDLTSKWHSISYLNHLTDHIFLTNVSENTTSGNIITLISDHVVQFLFLPIDQLKWNQSKYIYQHINTLSNTPWGNSKPELE